MLQLRQQGVPFSKGPHIVVLAFMFASTNLVIELGAVLWLLMGWQFVLAEVIGALILVALVWILGTFLFPKDEQRRCALRVLFFGLGDKPLQFRQ
jgi:Predicted permease